MVHLLLMYEFFAVAFSAFLTWHYPVSGIVSIVLGIIFFIAFNGLFVVMTCTHLSFFWAKEVTLFFSFSLAAVSYLTLLFIVNDFLLFIPAYGKLFFSYKLYVISVLSIVAMIIGLYAVWNTQNIRVQHYQLSSDKNTSARIVFLSDLHISPHNMSVVKLQGIFFILKTLKPDYVILGGDIIEMRPDYFMERSIIGAFRDFNTQNTVLAVVGNHEYYGGQIHDNVSAMEQAGIIVLKDAVRIVPEHNIAFIGRDDRTNSHRLTLNSLMKDIPENVYKIVIDHNPHSISETLETSADLQLSGHTHAGQIFPFNLLVKYLFDNEYGHKKFGKLDTIVSSGAGVWGPHIRIGTNNEITVIDINKDKF